MSILHMHISNIGNTHSNVGVKQILKKDTIASLACRLRVCIVMSILLVAKG